MTQSIKTGRQMTKYSFQIIYKPIVEMYVKLQEDLLEYGQYANTLKKLESESEEDYVKRMEQFVTKIRNSDEKAMRDVSKLLVINETKEPKQVAKCTEFYKTSEHMAIILKRLHELKDSKYSNTEIEKLLETVIFFFFSYTLRLCDNIYTTHTVKNENYEKPN